MKCYYHKETEASATCQVCNKALCNECHDLTSTGICTDCMIQENKNFKTALIKNYIIYFIGAILGGIVGALLFKDNSFWSIYVGIGLIPAVWTVFSIRSNVVVQQSSIVVIIMFLIKIVLSFALAFVSIPIFLFLLIRDTVRYIRHKKDTEKVISTLNTTLYLDSLETDNSKTEESAV